MVWQSGAGKCRHGQGSAITVVIEDSPDNVDKKRRRHMRSIFYPLSLRRLHQQCGTKLIATICFILLLLVAFVQIAKQGRAAHHLVVKVVKPSNLNRLDNPTRMVGGVRQCKRAFLYQLIYCCVSIFVSFSILKETNHFNFCSHNLLYS
jgi:hypothetical protein